MTKKKAIKKLSVEQERQLLLRPCRTRDELKAWIKYFLNLELPDVTVSRYSDTNPLDVIWEVYDICVNKNNPEDINELLFVAGRGSGKCSLHSTIVQTKSRPLKISNIVPGDVVWTGKSWQKVTQTFNEGIKPGITIHTKVGKKDGAFSFTGSLRHRIQAFDPKKGKIDWVYMPDLQPGQLVYKTAEHVYDDIIDMQSEDYEKGWMIGAICGDGCVRKHGKRISVSGADFKQHRYYVNLVYKYFGIKANKVRRVSKKAVSVRHSNRAFRDWFESYVDGDLAYSKKLKTLEHSPNFLAGFIAGMMDTDGSKDSITLANKDLIYQIAQILGIFGVNSTINNNRRPPSTTKYVKGHTVTYHEATYSKLPDYLLPVFSKREAFIAHREKQNEQFRYPSILIKSFAEDIKRKYRIGNGYWQLVPGAKMTRSKISFSKDLWGAKATNETYVYGYKLDSFIELAEFLKEPEWAEYLSFIRNGYFEKISKIEKGDHHFYDLEVENDHAYASNCFVSHNTLGMAIAELMIILHDQRDVVHVGAIQNQAERCYAYQKGFLYNRKIKPLVTPPNIPEDKRILEKANMSKSLFNIGHHKVTLEVLPCTLKACLVEDTMAESTEGLRKIRNFSAGDLIKSPSGWTTVIANDLQRRECLRVELDDGRVIEGTLDHKVMTNKGWVELQNLTDEHEII